MAGMVSKSRISETDVPPRPGRLALCIDYRWPRDWSRAALAAYRPDLGELLFHDGERLDSRWGEQS